MSCVSMIVEQQLAKLYFVLPAGDMADCENASEDMKMAYTTAREHHDNEELQEWISEGACLKLNEAHMTKKHVFVFEKFSGPAFERANKAPSTVIGPRCLISCFMGNETIPLGKHPVFTTAMRNLTVCSSGLKTKEKAHVSQLVYYMGGYYMDVLTGSCTHLVASTVKSVKYEEAAKIKLPILHPDWVQEVWEASQQRDVNATDACFITRHRLPVFHSLTITSTGLSLARKNEIKSLIEANGGNYIGAFKSEITDILILDRSGQGTAKFQAAVRSKKECLTPQWIEDSVAAGFALPIRGYEVKTIKASTPTKDDPRASVIATTTAAAAANGARSSDFNPDCTELSEISHANFSGRNLTINESVMSSAGGKEDNAVKPQPKAPRQVANTTHREVLVRMTVQQAKKAGHLLDGCSVYLSGFTSDEKEKLNKILNALGAVRYDELSAVVSHVIVGEQLASEMRELRDSSAHLLTLDWLAKSIEQKQLAPEESAEYTFRPSGKSGIVERVPEPPSPSSKQNLERLNSDVFKRPKIPKFRLDDGTTTGTASSTQDDAGTPQEPVPPPVPVASVEQQSIMMQYLEANKAERLPPTASQKDSIVGIPIPVASSTALSSGSQYEDSELESNACSDFMLGRTLFVFGFPEEDAVRIVSDLRQCGGTIVDESYHDEVDFIVLPTSCIGTVDFAIRGKQTVNCIWLETSIQEGECQPMEYYYEPIIYGEDDPRPLEGETLVISSYSGAERSFLIQLGSILGACVQERLVRKAAPLLVCKEASGAKYNAAIQWSLTVVFAEWLRECIRQKRRVAENPFLVGDSICSPKNIPSDAGGGGGGCLPTTSTDELDLDTMRAGLIPPPDVTSFGIPMGNSRTCIPLRTPQISATSDVRNLDTLRTESRTGFTTPKAPDSRMHLVSNDSPAISGGQYRYIKEKKTKDEAGLQYAFNSLSTPELRKLSSAERMVYSQELEEYGEMIAAVRARRKPFDPNDTSDCHTPGSCRMNSSVAGAGESPSCSSAQGTPVMAGEYEALSVTQRVQEFETPVRGVLYRALKEAEEKDRKLTPRTRRMQELLATPAAGGTGTGISAGHIRTPTLPDCMTKPVTPYGYRPDASPENHAYHKRKLQFWDRFYKGKQGPGGESGTPTEGGTPSQQQRRLSTPLSEFKRRFYCENLGEDYVNQIESRYNTQYQGQHEPNMSKRQMADNPEEEIAATQASPRPKAATVPSQPRNAGQDPEPGSVSAGQETAKGVNVSAEKRSRQAMEEEEEEEENEHAPVTGEADENVRKFSDFIKAMRDSAKKKPKYHADTEEPAGPPVYTELEAYDSELPGVGGVVWCDRGIEIAQTEEEEPPSSHPGGESSREESNDTPLDIVELCDASRRMKYRGTPLFAISGVSEETRMQLVQQIKQLKGEVADLSRYDPACTHVISNRPNRGEKTLSAIAAGKWVLSTTYIEDSLQAGFFLDEESYEWGNPKAVANLTPLDSTSDNETATASYTWRKRIATDGGKRDGAFTGFRVLLVPARKATLVRLLQSGGGYVLDCEPPFINSEQAMTATHCFVDRKATLSSEDQQVLGEAGVSVLSIMYLNAYLTSAKLPAESEFRLPA